MSEVLQIKGVRKAVKAIIRKRNTQVKALNEGIKMAGLYLQAQSQKVVPVEFGILKNSAFTRSENQEALKALPGFQDRPQQVVVGYTAYYAIYVHENMNATHAKGKQAKYLTGPASTNAAMMSSIVRKRARSVR